jgi:hypothetical protein
MSRRVYINRRDVRALCLFTAARLLDVASPPEKHPHNMLIDRISASIHHLEFPVP